LDFPFKIISYPILISYLFLFLFCSKEALRSIVISQRLLGTTEIAVFHHTDCGMLTFTNDDIRHKVKTEEPGNVVVAEAVDKIDFLTFPHLEESVKDDVDFLKASKLLKNGTHLSGWIYDVTNGKVCFLEISKIEEKEF
jgi:carbonic anhydrase